MSETLNTLYKAISLAGSRRVRLPFTFLYSLKAFREAFPHFSPFFEIYSRGRRPRRPEKRRIIDIRKIAEKCVKLLNPYCDNTEVDRYLLC